MTKMMVEVEVDADELAALRAEVERLRAREGELLHKNSELVYERQRMLTVPILVRRAHGVAREKGWWPPGDLDNLFSDPNVVPRHLALIHSEVSEALEVFRKAPDPWNASRFEGPKPVGFGSELADVVIRVADLCGGARIDLERELVEKMAFNATRPMRHGGRRC